MMDMKFATKLEKLCEQRGWSKAELARRMGVSKNTAGRWVEGERRPYDLVIVRLAKMLGVSLDYLLDDAIEQIPAPELTDDEAFILQVVRDLGLPRAEAVIALMGADRRGPSRPAEQPEPTPAPRYGTPIRQLNSTDNTVRRQAEKNRPTKAEPKKPGKGEEAKKPKGR